MSEIHIDGDLPSGKGCKYHCSPTIHPAQVGPEWKYGCTHPAWPQNRSGDFVPIVDCGGDVGKCDLCKTKLLGRHVGGLKRRVKNAEAKAKKFRALLDEVEALRAQQQERKG